MSKKVRKSDSEWREQLSPLAYKVTRRNGTERAFTNNDFPKGPGVFHCTCCSAPLFHAEAKYDSGSGWPSFYQPIAPEHIDEKEDRKLFMRRTEVLCSRCDAHLGHVFPDGPHPTGLRYCINGVALKYKADETK